MSTIKNYFSLVKFSHTIFAMPFALIGFFLGGKLWNDVTGYFHHHSYSSVSGELIRKLQIPASLSEIIMRFILVIFLHGNGAQRSNGI